MKLILSFISVLVINTSLHAQHVITPSERQADQKIISHYLYQLNKQLAIDSYDGDKSKLTKAKIDSLIGENRDRYTEGTVTYSPDNRFKIFVLKGEMVGGHINCIYEAFIHSAGRKQSIVVSPVERIFKLEADKYLIIQRETTCGGTVFYDYRKATVLSLVKGSWAYISFNYKYPADARNTNEQQPDGSLWLDQLTDDDHIYNPADSILLKFYSKTNKLQYRYRVDYSVCCDQDRISTFFGYFKWENGSFTHKMETRKDLKK